MTPEAAGAFDALALISRAAMSHDIEDIWPLVDEVSVGDNVKEVIYILSVLAGELTWKAAPARCTLAVRLTLDEMAAGLAEAMITQED